MTLKDYLATRSETVEDFAARVDASPGMIHKIVYRTRQPSLDLASRIATATEHSVGAFDMLLSERPTPQEAAA